MSDVHGFHDPVAENYVGLILPRGLFGAGFNPYELALILHVAFLMKTRTPDDFESVERLAEATGMSESKARRVLKSLTARGVLAKREREGEASIYWLTSPEKWKR